MSLLNLKGIQIKRKISFLKSCPPLILTVTGNLKIDDMKKNSIVLELMQRIIHPAMRNFAENDIIETLMPSFATKRTEFESFLLNCIMVMIAFQKTSPTVFKKLGVFHEFTFACLAFYENEKLFMPESNRFDEDKTTKQIFDRWNKYENALGRLANTNDITEIAEMIFEPQFGLQSVRKNMETNKQNLEFSMKQTMKLIGKELPLLI